MNKEIAQYINDLLADRERLMEERKDDTNQWQSIPELYADLKKDTEWELSYEGECTHETFDTKFEAEKSIHEYVINEFEEQAQ